jgi:hypothetical protein
MAKLESIFLLNVLTSLSKTSNINDLSASFLRYNSIKKLFFSSPLPQKTIELSKSNEFIEPSNYRFCQNKHIDIQDSCLKVYKPGANESNLCINRLFLSKKIVSITSLSFKKLQMLSCGLMISPPK